MGFVLFWDFGFDISAFRGSFQSLPLAHLWLTSTIAELNQGRYLYGSLYFGTVLLCGTFCWHVILSCLARSVAVGFLKQRIY